MHHSQMKSEVRRLIAQGTVIPAHPLALDAKGRFSCKGLYEKEHSGADRREQGRDSHPAHFSGWSDGRKMMLLITLTDTGQTIGEFSLSLGQEPQLTKCL